MPISYTQRFANIIRFSHENVGIKVLRRVVLRKKAILYFKEAGFELEFNAKKAKAGYQEQITSINRFGEKRREKRNVKDLKRVFVFVQKGV